MLLERLNNQHPNVKFEIEYPEINNTLSLLDFTLTLNDNSPKFTFYRKKARKNLFMHYRSHLPSKTKTSVIKNEKSRIRERCTDRQQQLECTATFNNVLRLNGYPETTIHETSRTHTRRRLLHPPHRPIDYSYFNLPFISDKIDRDINNIFRRENLRVRMTHTSYTLRHALKQRTPSMDCRMKSCPINDPSICFRSKIVYKIICNECKQFYIGSTIRHFHQRAKEHLTNTNSSIHKHRTYTSCSHATFTFTVVASDRDSANLRLREAFFIQKLHPQLNSRDELEAYRDFLYT